VCHPAPCMNNCRGRGDCREGVCECDMGWSGPDCSIFCTSNCVTCTSSS
jgi:syndecan 4